MSGNPPISANLCAVKQKAFDLGTGGELGLSLWAVQVWSSSGGPPAGGKEQPKLEWKKKIPTQMLGTRGFISADRRRKKGFELKPYTTCVGTGTRFAPRTVYAPDRIANTPVIQRCRNLKSEKLMLTGSSTYLCTTQRGEEEATKYLFPFRLPSPLGAL